MTLYAALQRSATGARALLMSFKDKVMSDKSATDHQTDNSSPAKDKATLRAERESRKASRALSSPLAAWTFDDQNPVVYKDFPSESADEAVKLARRMLTLAKRSGQAVELAYDGVSSLTLRLPAENGKVSQGVRAFARRVQRPVGGAETPAKG